MHLQTFFVTKRSQQEDLLEPLDYFRGLHMSNLAHANWTKAWAMPHEDIASLVCKTRIIHMNSGKSWLYFFLVLCLT